MAGELAHVSVGTELTQAEFEGTTLHQFNSQAAGDIAYASSTTQISRLAKGANGDSLTLASGVPAWNTAVQSNVTASRAIDGTAYQNTSGRPLFVTVTTRCEVNGSTAQVTGYSFISAFTDTNATPTTVVGRGGINLIDLNTSGAQTKRIKQYGTVSFVVLPSSYYKVSTTIAVDGVTPVLDYWFEWEI